MPTFVLLLAASILTAPEDKPAIQDYFDGRGHANQPLTTICNLNGEDVRGTFRTCRYDCGATLTVGERSVCPFILQR